jgi:hypothetical protein
LHEAQVLVHGGIRQCQHDTQGQYNRRRLIPVLNCY